ncbi:hypothetical protein [Nostoc sp. MG11]|uniref:hypothetical protein n=1 Tax=Nostoc sp. MG11 TaxID=2721166 RepID=UPI001868EBCA|nr:hypothetical protein [Nostoc sp. MG11]
MSIKSPRSGRTGACIEKFFAEIGVPVDDPEASSRPATPEAIERVLAAAPKYGIEFIA